MENILTPAQGIMLFVCFGSVMLLLAFFNRLTRRDSIAEFLLVNREVGVLVGAMSATITWIWAPILFVGAQKAYQQGLPGLLAFALPNSGAMILFAFIAMKVRQSLPNGYTLPEFMKHRHGDKVHTLYLIQFVGLQVSSFAIQILAGATLMHLITGLNFYVIALLLVGIVFIYTVLGGLRASIATDVLQLCLLLGGIAFIVPATMSHAGGVQAITSHLGGVAGFEQAPWVLYSFGIPVTVALLAGPMGDQMHWQRAFSFKNALALKRAYILGATIHVSIIFALGLLGFIAASHVDVINIPSAQMVGPAVVAHFLPTSALVLFSVMLLAGLCSTLDSVLCAVSSLAVVDVTQNRWSHHKVLIGRIGMFLTAICGMGIAFIPNVEILHLFLFAGTLRAATLLPSIMTVLNKKLSSRRVFTAILLSLLFGSPIYVMGTFIKNPHMVVLGSLIPVILGVLLCLPQLKLLKSKMQ